MSQIWNDVSYKEQCTLSNDTYFVPAVGRALNILALFSRDGFSMGVSELAHRLDLPRSSTYRLVYTLAKLGYLDYDAHTRKYTLSVRILTLTTNAAANLSLSKASAPYLRDLSSRFGGTVNLGMLIGSQVIVVQRIESRQTSTARFPVSAQTSLYASSLGKALLAYLPEDELQAAIASVELVPLGPRTITDADELLKDLRKVRERGFAINDEEMVPGIHAVSAPIRSAQGDVIAAVGISSLIRHLAHERLMTDVAPAVVEAAELISRSVGAV